MEKPLLFLDVDGVLNPFDAAPVPNGFEQYELAGYRVFLAQHHGEWLRELAPRVEMVWATTWGEQANELIGPILGLPLLPVIQVDMSRLDRLNCPPTWKLPDILSFVGRRSVIWIDDDLHSDAHAWAQARSVPTLLIQPLPGVGFTRTHLSRIDAFIDGLDGEPA